MGIEISINGLCPLFIFTDTQTDTKTAMVATLKADNHTPHFSVTEKDSGKIIFEYKDSELSGKKIFLKTNGDTSGTVQTGNNPTNQALKFSDIIDVEAALPPGKSAQLNERALTSRFYFDAGTIFTKELNRSNGGALVKIRVHEGSSSYRDTETIAEVIGVSILMISDAKLFFDDEEKLIFKMDKSYEIKFSNSCLDVPYGLDFHKIYDELAANISPQYRVNLEYPRSGSPADSTNEVVETKVEDGFLVVTTVTKTRFFTQGPRVCGGMYFSRQKFF